MSGNTGLLPTGNAVSCWRLKPTGRNIYRRNRLPAHIADTLLIIHAEPGSQTEKLCRDLIQSGKKLLTLDFLKRSCL
jgi:hypothetical protein